MNHQPHRQRSALIGTLVAVALTVATFTASPSGAATVEIPISWRVDASTHIRSLGMDVTIPPGTFDGVIVLDPATLTGTLTGDLDLPPASKTIRLFGYPIASTTFAMSQHAPITGTVDLNTNTVVVDSSFDFAITNASLSLLPRLNLVGRSCKGKSPIEVSMTGTIDLADLNAPQTFQADYTLPKLKNCGLGTGLINLIVPGGGNTFTASFAPAG